MAGSFRNLAFGSAALAGSFLASHSAAQAHSSAHLSAGPQHYSRHACLTELVEVGPGNRPDAILVECKTPKNDVIYLTIKHNGTYDENGNHDVSTSFGAERFIISLSKATVSTSYLAGTKVSSQSIKWNVQPFQPKIDGGKSAQEAARVLKRVHDPIGSAFGTSYVHDYSVGSVIKLMTPDELETIQAQINAIPLTVSTFTGLSEPVAANSNNRISQILFPTAAPQI